MWGALKFKFHQFISKSTFALLDILPPNPTPKRPNSIRPWGSRHWARGMIKLPRETLSRVRQVPSAGSWDKEGGRDGQSSEESSDFELQQEDPRSLNNWTKFIVCITAFHPQYHPKEMTRGIKEGTGRRKTGGGGRRKWRGGRGKRKSGREERGGRESKGGGRKDGERDWRD